MAYDVCVCVFSMGKEGGRGVCRMRIVLYAHIVITIIGKVALKCTQPSDTVSAPTVHGFLNLPKKQTECHFVLIYNLMIQMTATV